MLRRAFTVSPRRLTRLAVAAEPMPEREPTQAAELELELQEPKLELEPEQSERLVPTRPRGLALLQRLGLQPAGWPAEEPR